MLNSDAIREPHPESKPIRFDEADLVILRELSQDARVPNNILAQRAGLAPSTCLNRVRTLREAGVIRGFHADLDLSSLGLDVAAMISIRVHSQARKKMLELARTLRDLPETLNVFVLGGEYDLLLHVVCGSTADLRKFVEKQLGGNPAFINTQTTLIFEHLQPAAKSRSISH
ncbi:Lrp/AsnC family transcriptional regulator [Psychromicrobium lacuslunae]|uniref:AsnC family transcriptional regulator n=1 Tax=Psychromicrobium lacuslunae TaxID=1618207 RepID=A0A0D4BYD7_9MICC|nr:Lrp/AsnC family transcriptional regulator [Psychromicrobium lacuslunae]AJT41477.1 AsnC family transcriptional regulator [Psychromicrobium lacuslunae]